MKKIIEVTKNVDVKREDVFLSTNNLKVLKTYPVVRRLNFKRFLGLGLIIASFIIGKTMGVSETKKNYILSDISKRNYSSNYFKSLKESKLSHLRYKKIDFKHYIDSLDNREYESYSHYLSQNTTAYEMFREDMDYNRKIFIAKHDIIGKDRMKYLDFNHRNRILMSDFRKTLEKHRDQYRDYDLSIRKIERLANNN